METRKIGILDATVIGVGCNNFGRWVDEAEVAAIANAALDEGINYFDTADAYGHPGSMSERFLGSALAARRDEAVIATKFGHKLDEEHQGGAKPAYIRACVEDSLTRLGTDRIDLFQLHHYDPDTPVAETLDTLAELVREGKILEFGCTNFSLAQLEEAAAAVKPPEHSFASTQNQYSLLERSAELDVLPECQRTGLALVPSRSLYFGMLTGKYKRGEAAPVGTRMAADWYARDRNKIMSEPNFDVVEGLSAFAEARNHSILELALAWLIARPGVATVLAGVSSVSQVHANANAASWALSDDELAEIDLIAPPA